jgi:radical SAM superfamily enzyme YgiQ (UPF0313 family)
MFWLDDSKDILGEYSAKYKYDAVICRPDGGFADRTGHSCTILQNLYNSPNPNHRKRVMMRSLKPLNILLVNPKIPTSYWGFQESTWFVGSKAAHIPLPLITLAALLPSEWRLSLIDMNIERLTDGHIAGADLVLLTGMIIQKQSLQEVVERCQALSVPTVVGGPFVSCTPDAPELDQATSLVIGEAESGDLVRRLVADIRCRCLKPRYLAEGKPSMDRSPTPRYDLLKRKSYIAMAVQTSRGCPHLCEFCNVRMLFGRRPRYKRPEQVVAELQAIYETGFRGNVFFVDDNFVGNVHAARKILEAVERWQGGHGRPFLFYTEADIRLADRDDLADLMVRSGFFSVFVGIESASEEALREAAKTQNLKRDIVEAVSRLRQRGLLVYAGFIVGFDADDSGCFERLQRLVDSTQIDFAMANMLVALPGTPLEARLREEGRLLEGASVDTFADTNIQPKRMSRLELVQGYRKLMMALYDPKRFFARAYAAISEWQQGPRRRTTWRELLAVPRSIVRQGIFSRYAGHYWKFMLKTLFRHPKKIVRAFATAISGHHFFRYTKREVIPSLRQLEERLRSEAAAEGAPG